VECRLPDAQPAFLSTHATVIQECEDSYLRMPLLPARPPPGWRVSGPLHMGQQRDVRVRADAVAAEAVLARQHLHAGDMYQRQFSDPVLVVLRGMSTVPNTQD
jgi:hypothetical protein